MDNSDSSWDKEIHYSLWIKYCTSGVSIEEDRFDFFGIIVVDSKDLFTTSCLGFGDLKCDQEVGGDGEGVSLLEWLTDLDLLAIHS